MRASVLPQAAPGHATLRISDLDASPNGLTISIQRQQGPESHLADEGWRRTETWLQPARVARVKDALELQLGPEICDRLAGIATVRLRVKEPDIGVVGTTVVAWPRMLTSGALDPARRSFDDTVHLSGRATEPPPPAPPFEPPAEPEAVPELRAERDPAPPVEPAGRGRTKWMIAAVIVLLLAGGGYLAYTNYIERPAEAVASAVPEQSAAVAPAPGLPKKSVRETVAEYLATNPAPEAMLARGKELAQAGETSAAFLVWRRAAEAGNVPAQVELAAFYDPLAMPAKAGFAPDAARAADWYERAALAGNAEAQRKFGLLLAKGAAGLPADQGRARSWLQQAAAQNDAEARKALESLAK